MRKRKRTPFRVPELDPEDLARRNRPQESCLVNQDGAGITYMRFFEALDPQERQVLREAHFNLCVLCYIKERKRFNETPQEVVLRMEKEFLGEEDYEQDYDSEQDYIDDYFEMEEDEDEVSGTA